MRKYVYINLIGLLLIGIFIHYKVVSIDASKIFIMGLFGVNVYFLRKFKDYEKNK